MTTAVAMSKDESAPAKISLVISDVDGTLMTDDKVLKPSVVQAVRDLHAAGINFAVTSSRPPRGMAMLIEPLALDTPLAGFNGGAIVRSDMSVIEGHALDADVASRAVELIRNRGLDAWVFSADEWFIHPSYVSHVALEKRTVGFLPILVEDFTLALKGAIKIVGVGDDPDLVALCEADIQAALGARASAARSQPYYLDITHPVANKGVVVAAMSRLLSIPRAEIAVIGDGSNDIPMFEQSALSIAMGNARPSVKAAARFTTASNAEDGFAEAMYKFVLDRAPPAMADKK